MVKNNYYITTSWDDGTEHDLVLSKLLAKYNIPATFYISHISRVKNRLPKRFEVGGHTKDHRVLTEIGKIEVKKQIANDKQLISFAYPKGRYDQNVKQLVGAVGYQYARTTKLFETQMGDILLAGTTVHAYSHNLLLYLKEGFNKLLFYKLTALGCDFSDWEDIAKKSLDIVISEGGIYHLWGHSWEIDKNNDWQKLERVLAYISQKTDLKSRINNCELVGINKIKKSLHYEQNSYASYDKNAENMIYYLSKKYDKKGVKILELGCGEGNFLHYFKKADYMGIDYKHSSKWDNKHFKVLDFKKLNDLKLPKQDLIIVWGLLEDETSLELFLHRLTSVSGKNTLIVFTVHNANNVLFQLKEFIRRQMGLRAFAYSSYTKKHLTNYISKDVVDLGEYLVVLSKDEN